MNNVLIVGRLTRDPEIIETENGHKRSFVVLAIPRSYKNKDGEYEADFVKCVLWNAIATHTHEYCKCGDIIGIKGHLETSTYEKEGTTVYESAVIAEKVTFLGSKKSDIQSEISATEE